MTSSSVPLGQPQAMLRAASRPWLSKGLIISAQGRSCLMGKLCSGASPLGGRGFVSLPHNGVAPFAQSCSHSFFFSQVFLLRSLLPSIHFRCQELSTQSIKRVLTEEGESYVGAPTARLHEKRLEGGTTSPLSHEDCLCKPSNKGFAGFSFL